MDPVKLSPGNIWSGNRTLAVFTNPTELAFWKGNLKHHWPVEFLGRMYDDVEAAYHAFKQPWHSFEDLQDAMVDMIACKFRTYPVLQDSIRISGGADWIKQCYHLTGARTKGFKRWEGQGLESAFIRCLHRAFEQVTNEGGDPDD